MSTYIGKILTEVVPAPEGPEAQAGGGAGNEVARLRRELARAERQAERLRAEHFDD